MVRAGARAARERHGHAPRAGGDADRRARVPRARDRVRARLSPVNRADRRGSSDRALRPVRGQQARAGDARAPRRPCARLRRTGPSTMRARGSRPPTSPRASRGRLPRSKPGSATRSYASGTSSRGATSRTCGTPCGRTGCCCSTAVPRAPTTCARAGRIACETSSMRSSACRTASIDIEVDPSRLRPSDNPVVAGDHSRISAETGWTPGIPIERTLDDLLNYWRPRRPARPRAPHDPHACPGRRRRAGLLRRRPAAGSHRHGRLRAPAALSQLVGRRRAGGVGHRLQPVRAAANCRRAAVSSARVGQEVLLGRHALSRLHPAAALRAARSAGHRGRVVGGARVRRRHGDARGATRQGPAHPVEQGEVAGGQPGLRAGGRRGRVVPVLVVPAGDHPSPVSVVLAGDAVRGGACGGGGGDHSDPARRQHLRDGDRCGGAVVRIARERRSDCGGRGPGGRGAARGDRGQRRRRGGRLLRCGPSRRRARPPALRSAS